MNTIQGDLLKFAADGRFDVIIHGCNCMCAMSAGIARQIKAQLPEAYEADCETEKGSREKLGEISHATVRRGDHTLTIVNGYTQYHWKGPNGRADYDAIRAVMQAVKQQFSGQRIGYPKVGAGLASGDWEIISKIIDEELAGEDHTLVEYVAS